MNEMQKSNDMNKETYVWAIERMPKDDKNRIESSLLALLS